MKEGMMERRKEEYRKEGKMEDKKTGKISVKLGSQTKQSLGPFYYRHCRSCLLPTNFLDF